jgi:hypothetical protein
MHSNRPAEYVPRRNWAGSRPRRKAAAGLAAVAGDVNPRVVRPPRRLTAGVMRSVRRVLKMPPETEDEPGTQSDAAKEEKHSKERPENRSWGYGR